VDDTFYVIALYEDSRNPKFNSSQVEEGMIDLKVG
jgi:hypothetical protein